MISFKNGLAALICICELVFDTLSNVVIECGSAEGLEMDFQALFAEFINLKQDLKDHFEKVCKLFGLSTPIDDQVW